VTIKSLLLPLGALWLNPLSHEVNISISVHEPGGGVGVGVGVGEGGGPTLIPQSISLNSAIVLNPDPWLCL